MAADESLLTYDDLTSISRVEKSSRSLSAVRKDLYPAMLALFERQSQECERLVSEDADSIMFDGASDRKKKIRQLMMDITQFRMNKIAELAVNGAMGLNNVLDTLTPEERKYYETLLEASKEHWALLKRKKKSTQMNITQPEGEEEPAKEEITVLGTTVENVVPEYSDSPPTEIPERVSEPPIAIPIEDIDEFPEDPEENAEIEDTIPEIHRDEMPVNPPIPVKEQPKPKDDGQLLVRVLEDLQPFSGMDNIVYRLKKEDIVRLPSLFAMALVNRGVAELISITS